MRAKKPYVILTFDTTHAAMAVEKECMEKGIPGRIIPLPREISAGCGLSFRIPEAEYVTYQEEYERMQYKEAVRLML